MANYGGHCLNEGYETDFKLDEHINESKRCQRSLWFEDTQEMEEEKSRIARI